LLNKPANQNANLSVKGITIVDEFDDPSASATASFKEEDDDDDCAAPDDCSSADDRGEEDEDEYEEDEDEYEEEEVAAMPRVGDCAFIVNGRLSRI
jgi:hypothetical protein